MWIRVYPNRKMNFNSKNGLKRSFSYEIKASFYLSQWGEWICGTWLLKERRLLCKSVIIAIQRWTLILTMVEREVFLMWPKHQYLLSQWGEMYWWCPIMKKRQLLCGSMFIPIDRRTLILKNGWKWNFFDETKASIHLSQSVEWIMVPNH